MLAPEDQCHSINLYSIVFTRIYVLELHDFNNSVAGTLMSSFVLAYYPFYATNISSYQQAKKFIIVCCLQFLVF